jgi:hypothetical protein
MIRQKRQEQFVRNVCNEFSAEEALLQRKVDGLNKYAEKAHLK